MSQVPDAAVGAIVAALIAGTISLLGLVISKEQKTSEFRQAWIDALRISLTAYITRINAIQDAIKASFRSQAEKVEALHAHYVPLNTATFDILLRINSKEGKSKKLLDAMDRFNELFLSDKDITVDKIRPIEADFLLASQDLLKHEWRRVKSGEITFRIAKLAALAVVLAASGLGVWAFIEGEGGRSSGPAQAASTAEVRLGESNAPIVAVSAAPTTIPPIVQPQTGATTKQRSTAVAAGGEKAESSK